MNKKSCLVAGAVVIVSTISVIFFLFTASKKKKNDKILDDYFNRDISEFVPKNLFEQHLDPSPINRHSYIPVSKHYKNTTNYPHKHNLPR